MRKLTIMIALLLVVALATPAIGASFPDVPSNHWAYDAVNKLVASGIIEGYPDGTFKGQENLTRYEIAMVVSRALDNIAEERQALMDKVESMEEDETTGLSTEQAQDVTAIVKSLIEKNMPEPQEPPTELTEEQADQVVDLIEALTFEYQAELKVIGSDIESLQMDMEKVKERVTALENEEPVVSFSGLYSVDFERVTTEGTGIVPADEADAESVFGPYDATDYFFMDPYSTSSGSYVAQVDSDTDANSTDFRLTDEGDYYEEGLTFENTLDLNIAVNKGPLSADLDLVASSNVFGGAESGSFALDDLSGTITAPDFTATIANDQTVTFKDYLFDETTVDGVVASTDSHTFFVSRTLEEEWLGDNGVVYNASDDYDYYERNYLRAGADMNFDLMLPLNVVYGYEYSPAGDYDVMNTGGNDLLPNNGYNSDDTYSADEIRNAVLGFSTWTEFAGMNVTADFATSLYDNVKVQNDYLFELGASGQFDMFDLTFNYVKNQGLTAIEGTSPTEGYDVEVAGSLGMVDASVYYEDYGTAETTLKASVEEGEFSVAGIDVDGSYRLTTDENDAKKEVREINASTLVSGASLSYYYEYDADNDEYDEPKDRLDDGQSTDLTEEDADVNEHKFIADYSVNDSISVYGESVFEKDMANDATDIVWEDSFTNTNEVGADYESGPISAGVSHVFGGDTTLTGRYTADMFEAGFSKVLDGDLVIDGKVMSPVYTMYGVDVSAEAMMKRNIDAETQNLSLMVDMSKDFNERFAMTAGMKYADKEIDVDNDGVKVTANAGLEYTISEDVTANADYEYLDWTGDSTNDYSAQKATMGVSVAF